MTVAEETLRDESGRIAALQQYEVLDTPREASFDRITTLVKTILNVPICAVSLIDTDRQWFKSCVGLEAEQTSRDISFCTHTIMERVPLYVPDAVADPRFSANPLVTGAPFIRSYLGIPLATPKGYNLGSLCVIDTVPRSYATDQIELLMSFAQIVMDELELRKIAQTDHLTGATSRRGFMSELEKTLARARRSGESSALVLLDLDRFKSINDTYGHPMGDRVLCAVSSLLRSSLRDGDTFGRVGGEEFGIILANAPTPEAVAIADRLRLRLEQNMDDTIPIQVTASIGITAIDRKTLSVEQAMAIADRALYEAKATGRNRCIFCQE